MDTNELIKMNGELVVTKTNENGIVTEELRIPNLVVTAGKTYIASRMVGTAATVMSHMGIGTGTTAAAAGDTDLGAISGTRQTVTASASANVVTYSATFGAGVGTGAITEAGIFNAATAGSMLCRTVFSAVNKGASDSIAITWNVTVS